MLATFLATLSACGGGAAAPTTSVSPTPEAIVTKCGETQGAQLTPVSLPASDGQRLYAAAGGSGRVGIVLAPESPPGNVCGWLPYIATLEHAGLRVVAFDFRETGTPTSYARDFAAAIARARSDGAKRVVVIGASLGGARALTFGSRLDADAIVSLSGEATLPEFGVDALPHVPNLRVPLLLVGSRHDGYLSVASMLQLLRHAGSKDKRTAFFAGDWHGWQIVENAPYAPRARAVILRWIRAHTAP